MKKPQITELKGTSVYADVMTFIAKFINEFEHKRGDYVVMSEALFIERIEKNTCYGGSAVASLFKNGFYHEKHKASGAEKMFIFKLDDFEKWIK